ncbi:hypothetical protein ANANG_G00066970 [Anguilla anguilla]|uniref:Uncharacterized protein n=1 Tax=Anguilla anguilla TaxID=7936 RepID=A0A9D3MPX2_ANGAN|nr:hypothetical protein ANANG_G00066970 [Anguilla anguilla]
MAQQQGRTQQPLPPHPPPPPPRRPPPAPASQSHRSQPVRPLPPTAQPVQYSAVSYPPQLLPVSPNQQYTVQDSLGAQFGHMTLAGSRPARAPTPTPPCTPAVVLHPPAGRLHGGAPGQPLPPPLRRLSPAHQPAGHAAAGLCAAANPADASVLLRIRPVPPLLSVPACHPSALQQCSKPAAHVPPQPAARLSDRDAGPAAELSRPGRMQPAPPQSVMVQYPSVPSYQVRFPRLCNARPVRFRLPGRCPYPLGSQGVVQQTPQQPMVIPNQCSQGPCPPRRAGVLQCHPTRSTEHGELLSRILPPPGTEQIQFPRTPPSPCVSQQFPGQQCAGVPLPGGRDGHDAADVALGPQTPAHSPTQWKQHKYYSLDHQRGQKFTEPPALDTSQSSLQLGSPVTSPTQSLTPAHLTNAKNIRPGLAPVSILPHFHRTFVPGQGDARYRLLGQPLQYTPPIRPPVLHGPHVVPGHQGPAGTAHGGRAGSRRERRCRQISLQPRQLTEESWK